MIKIAIIDDEINVRELIKKMLKLISSSYVVVGEAASISGAKDMLTNCKPDLVFLDIELEDGSGFNLLEQLPQIHFKLVFITAFNEFAIRAFKYNAFDYILKPIAPEELKNTLKRVESMVYVEKETKTQLKNLKENRESTIQKIALKTAKKMYLLEVDAILYCQSDGSYTKVVTENETILVSKNLKHYQELLPENIFIRTHQSYLVNKRHILSLENDTILLKNNETVAISARRKSEIKAILSNG